MSVPEIQLETWSHIGSLVQSASTYQSIKAVIENGGAKVGHGSGGMISLRAGNRSKFPGGGASQPMPVMIHPLRDATTD